MNSSYIFEVFFILFTCLCEGLFPAIVRIGETLCRLLLLELKFITEGPGNQKTNATSVRKLTSTIKVYKHSRMASGLFYVRKSNSSLNVTRVE